jgi:hypothetical protein
VFCRNSLLSPLWHNLWSIFDGILYQTQCGTVADMLNVVIAESSWEQPNILRMLGTHTPALNA